MLCRLVSGFQKIYRKLKESQACELAVGRRIRDEAVRMTDVYQWVGRWVVFFATTLFAVAGGVTDDFIAAAEKKHEGFGGKSARFLVEHMADADREVLKLDFLMENLDLAVKARETYPWAKEVPEEIFLNDVLPYAVFDEPRDPWRKDFFQKAGGLVKGAKSAAEAAQILNRDFFKLIKTHYDTKRERVNQSPAESIRQGRATCTGLSILLVDACRAVGIPARAVGTPMWWNNSGNHTWVEIWDKEWHFMGADEYNDKGLNHAWFVSQASKAMADDPMYSIYATSWKRDGGFYPMIWAPRSQTVGAVNVTARYAGKAEEVKHTVGVRFLEGRERKVVKGELTTEAGNVISRFETKAGTADMNDTPQVVVTPGKRYRWRFEVGGKTMESAPFSIDGKKLGVHDIRLADLKPIPDFTDEDKALSREEARRAVVLTYEVMVAEQEEIRSAELQSKTITLGDKTMKWLEKTFGDEPADGRSLWISMHGGGEAPAHVNEQQWKNQIRLYQPKEGIYVAPRAPTDKWNMWHQEHIDPMFARLIESMVAVRGVNPNKIYLMGYSAGGDGVWQLAPRMADRFGAASMMAGHPNEASLLGLRNLPFAIFMGENDHAVNRAKVAAEKTAALAELQRADTGGYVHISKIYPGFGHWMNLKDAESVPWMAKFERNPWPKKIVWYQDDVTHDRFYWLRLPDGAAAKDKKIIAEVKGQVITMEGDVPKGTKVLLSDELLDLNKPVKLIVNGGPEQLVLPKPQRSLKVIRECLAERLDPVATPVAEVLTVNGSVPNRASD
jgi:pimeloyl-ACP methyl ester carboxylesterase